MYNLYKNYRLLFFTYISNKETIFLLRHGDYFVYPRICEQRNIFQIAYIYCFTFPSCSKKFFSFPKVKASILQLSQVFHKASCNS